jgi:preprotein translocase subunit SecY
MAVVRGIFWVALFIIFTFCFVVLFEYGPRDFARGIQKEYARVKSFVVKQTEGIGKQKKNR